MQGALLFQNRFLETELLTAMLFYHGQLLQADFLHELLETFQRLLLVLDADRQRQNFLFHPLFDVGLFLDNQNKSYLIAV